MIQALNLSERIKWAPGFLFGSASIGSLLLYFNGALSMATGVVGLLLPASLFLALATLWSRKRDIEFTRMLVGGIWAGALATFAYDIVRVPIVMGGVPVFKAISYFGMVILDAPTLGPLTELAGWSYHLSNGIGFALMYCALQLRPRWWTAVIWGTVLEMAMLATPYAEVFGYKRSATFMAITIGAHIVYGLVLWLGLVAWRKATAHGAWPSLRFQVLGVLGALGVGMIGVGANPLHKEIKLSPLPGDAGEHLYTTWNVPEIDRLIVLWLYKTRIDDDAKFHFIEPFSPVPYGKTVDIPQGDLQRRGASSATETLIEEQGWNVDSKLQVLANVAHHSEITPWFPLKDPTARHVHAELKRIAASCTTQDMHGCISKSFSWLDEWQTRRD